MRIITVLDDDNVFLYKSKPKVLDRYYGLKKPSKSDGQNSR